ncbi:MAG: chemotaxis-specific protein-glutamate methyltransferase CheB [Planctomycetota bacterium]|nr:chemotaxis-specific protein-glutamate methyltransferase CheB [Planctomycetota bacterium]
MPSSVRVLIASSANNERSALQAELQTCPDIKVVALSGDIFSALEALMQVKPDVMLLDLDMPGGGSLALMHKIMKSRPTPIIAMFADGGDGQVAAAQALALGAADTQAKRSGRCSMSEMVVELCARIFRVANSGGKPRRTPERTAIASRVSAPSRKAPAPTPARAATGSVAPAPIRSTQGASTRAILIGASTGGTQALSRVLEPLPGNLPGIAIVQHMPPDFTGRLAERLNRRSDVTVVEAEDGMLFQPGHAYIAPGGLQFALKRVGSEVRVALSDGPLEGGHKPAVEHLFASVARLAELDVMAIMLTGMGSDGSQAMKTLHDQGALTVVQDEATCVVFGMPREAIRAGAASHVLALDDISPKIIGYGQEAGSGRGAA